MPRVALDESCVKRALEVKAMLAERSRHRAVPLPDLLVAACAERSGLTALHYDADFERIAELTGQATRWVVPRGGSRGPATRSSPALGQMQPEAAGWTGESRGNRPDWRAGGGHLLPPPMG